MNDTNFLQRLQADIEDRDLFSPGAKLVVGVSGGVDSVVLLHALKRLREAQRCAFDLHVAHFNHGLRGSDSDADAAFVNSLAEKLGLPCTVERAPQDVDKERSSSEDTARRARFDFFERVCANQPATHVALGHHADDQVETVLHRLMRGTGIRGLSGMPTKRPLNRSSEVMLIKPILGFSRSEIATYAEANALAYREDASNASPAHTRNRVRRELLPMLEASFNPHIREAIIRLAEQCRWTNAFVQESASLALEQVVVHRGHGSISLDREQFVKLSKIVQATVVRLALVELDMRERRLTHRHVTDILNAVVDVRSTGRFSLPDGVDAQFDRMHLKLTRNQSRNSP